MEPTPSPTLASQTFSKYYIETFGCQMNVADTQAMQALLEEGGMQEATNAESADLILVNGCSVRDKAVHKAVSKLGRYQDFKKNKNLLIGLGGCVGQLDRGEIFKRAPYVDFVFGPDAIPNLPEIVHQVKQGEIHQAFVEFDRDRNYSTETKVKTKQRAAYVNIMKGCDKFCTYCIVPYTRGREKSRLIEEVVEDVVKLVSRGIREVTLLGQNVNSFGKGNPNHKNLEPRELSSPIGKVGPRLGDENFPQLLRALDQDPRLESLKRIRFTSSHPLDFSDELLDCYRLDGGVSKLAWHLHLPVQSGSDRVLQKMGRHHSIETYLAQMKRLKTMNPEIGISTDLIVGFPTETDQEFEMTCHLLRELEYDSIYAFAYSPRPGTKAEKLDDDVPAQVKSERLNRLLSIQEEISKRRYQSRVGRQMEVMVEAEAKNRIRGKVEKISGKLWSSRTSCNRIVIFESDSPRDLTGEFFNVSIQDATSFALYGEVVV